MEFIIEWPNQVTERIERHEVVAGFMAYSDCGPCDDAPYLAVRDQRCPRVLTIFRLNGDRYASYGLPFGKTGEQRLLAVPETGLFHYNRIVFRRLASSEIDRLVAGLSFSYGFPPR